MNEGLAERHAYTVLCGKTVNGHKYITVRNPWKSMTRVYDMTVDKNNKASYTAKSHEGEESGIFDMELNDFMGHMNWIFLNEKVA